MTRKLDKLGYRGIDTAELVFEDCRVPATNLIGESEGRGLQQILTGLELGRINIAARGVGIARACLTKSIEYSQVRETFGKPICEHQAIQIKLADMATQVEAARLLTEQAARAYDKGERCDMEAGMAKLAASEAAFAAASHVSRLRLENNRVVIAFMEPRAAVAEWDQEKECYTLRVGCQSAHGMRGGLAAVLGVDEAKVRVVVPDTGGGFGARGAVNPELVVALLASR